MAVENLTKENFDEKTGTGVALIDFWAPWCGPCRMLTPVMEELDKELGDDVTFGKINVDEQSELAQKFEVRSIPAVFIMKDGKTVDVHVGVKSKQEYITALQAVTA